MVNIQYYLTITVKSNSHMDTVRYKKMIEICVIFVTKTHHKLNIIFVYLVFYLLI